ncbi:IclR family transcriptional regulator [Arthrobacter sp. NicSoilB8]|uniref:IclR family transcriptional regulator n=1 Tax=Arthrobacter sp. NicSoilB8 TaxID=2830998 RepID=UPI001CC50320|nr:IclR family transcriptional regulator [Arthrobacter sp. NicSoilB8]BCW73509.1 IclR family transcriptional regulator [Arthrobacter sp. NicSoilB8]BCW73555.1 IclR family transcriptional regulator [Arthrobacter sp. NicSoilB8]
METEQKQSGAARVMAVLEALSSGDAAEFPDGMTVSDVSRALGRDKSVVSRQLKSLLETGLVARDPEGRYELSWRLFALALRAGDQRLTKMAVPMMFRLTAVIRERSYLTVFSDGEVLTVHTESSHRSIEAVGWAGRTVPLNRSSSGMALLMDYEDDQILEIVRRGQDGLGTHAAREYLAHVREARETGYTVANRIFDPELIGVGAPVRDHSGRIIAAVNISGPDTRVEPNILVVAGQILSMVRAVQQSLSPGTRVFGYHTRT